MAARRARGRRLALALAIPVTLCLAGGGWLSRQRIVEEWCIFRLRSSDPGMRGWAAEKLAAMRSLRAIPKLIAALEGNPGHLIALIRIGPRAVAALLDAMEEDDGPPELRRAALKMLLDLGPAEAKEIAPSLAA